MYYIIRRFFIVILIVVTFSSIFTLFGNRFDISKFDQNSKLTTQSFEYTSYLFDSTELANFWRNFQIQLAKGNKSKIKESLYFPIQAYHLVVFQFAIDCDTLKFNTDMDKYLDVQIDSTNFSQYYNFIFSEDLQNMILNTDVDLLFNSYHSRRTEMSLTYVLFPKEYIHVKCRMDKSLHFHFFKTGDSWKISISGVH